MALHQVQNGCIITMGPFGPLDFQLAARVSYKSIDKIGSNFDFISAHKSYLLVFDDDVRANRMTQAYYLEVRVCS